MPALNWKIAGAAGEGIKVSGLILSKALFRQGVNIHGYTEYPSLIRGGHNTFQVAASIEKAHAPKVALDVMVALNANAVLNHQEEFTDQTAIVADLNLIKNDLTGFKRQNQIIDIPLAKIARDSGGGLLVKNTVALGASGYLLNLPLESLNQILTETFARKGEEVVKLNHQAASLGYDYVKTNFPDKKLNFAYPGKPPADKIFLTGNEAIALGAVAGGLKFYTAYPMTPTPAILHYLAAHADQFGLVVRHGENEIGVVNSAIGAAFAGVRSMVATSGGGFSLMTEGLGLSGVTETPLVVVLGMRPGPASGMPTWSSQGDLLFAINASQDEFPRLVFTPGDPAEAFEAARLAQNLSEKYQTPALVLTDKYLSESYFTVDRFADQHLNQRHSLADSKALPNDQPFPRYQLTDNGISPRPLPGTPGGVHLTNSYEHDELGYATEESKVRTAQVDKRNRKFASMSQEESLPQPVLFGPQNAATTIVSWGSNKGVIRQALNLLPDVNFIHLPLVWPFPEKTLAKLLASAKKLVTLECNSTGQLNRLIREQTGITIDRKLLKYDGRPFYPEEIVEKL
ncbi:hypothetical protein A2584_00640 [Candidatus Beckwithbacteria bacterium RIFOXYD1_FULL_50_11]|nr:MAG: hypothetical protein A2584_00640 [Candidatus Beckwithbacteria bacterium RIFOXYD1_FULL_50_11]